MVGVEEELDVVECLLERDTLLTGSHAVVGLLSSAIALPTSAVGGDALLPLLLLLPLPAR